MADSRGSNFIMSMQSASMDEDLAHFFDIFMPPSGKVLDLGCGYGETVIPVLEANRRLRDVEYWGIDILHEAGGENFKNVGKRNFVYGDATRIDFPENFFDVIVASNVIEHVENLDRALTEMKRVLKKGGVAIFLVPIEGKSIAGLLYKYSNPYKNIRIILNAVGLLPYSFHSPHLHFFRFSQWNEVFGRHFQIIGKHARGSMLMVTVIFFHNLTQLVFRQKMDLMNLFRKFFPRLFKSAYRKNRYFKMRATFIATK